MLGVGSTDGSAGLGGEALFLLMAAPAVGAVTVAFGVLAAFFFFFGV